MIRQSILGLGLGLCASLLIACGANQPTAVPAANMVNPASAFCTQNGGTLSIRQDAAGNQTGFCGFPDGSECEEWAFQRGECRPTSQNQASSDASVKRLTMQDNNSKITLKKGEIIEIVLESNPSTGFAWSTGPDAGKLLQQQGAAQFQSSDPRPGITGAGGTETFYFQTVEVGSGSFALAYQRGFETADPNQLFLIEVEVTE